MFPTPPGQKAQRPWGQSWGEVMTATTATPLIVRVGFFRRSGVRSFRSSGSTLARMSELGGTSQKPCFLQSFSFRFCRESRSLTFPALTAPMSSSERKIILLSAIEHVSGIRALGRLGLLRSALQLVHAHDGCRADQPGHVSDLEDEGSLGCHGAQALVPSFERLAVVVCAPPCNFEQRAGG